MRATGDDRHHVDTATVRALVDEQFPHWVDLPLEPVLPGGWDNTTYRLGSNLSVRLPTAERYAAQVAREAKWLPKIGACVSCDVPTIVEVGGPSARFARPWSVRAWIDGDTPSAELIDTPRFATEMAAFLVELHRVDSTDGPVPGTDNFWRGGDLRVYDAEARTAIAMRFDEIDVAGAYAVLDQALVEPHVGPNVWVHGDFHPANVLTRGDELHAVIDFGQLCVGDPACDLAIAWASFTGAARVEFRDGIDVDDATWNRARGWALWKAAISRAPNSVRIMRDLCEDA